MLNGLDLFSGIGGLSIALGEWVKPVAYCEVDRYAQAVLLSRMHDGTLYPAPIWDDVRTLRGSMLPEVDIIYGGFPCQDISIAGDGKGLEGERSKLFFEVVRLVSELRPRFIFLENVPAITYRGLERVCMELTALGYDSRWTIVSAGELGAPHLRERWWLLSHDISPRLQESRGEQDKKSKPQREEEHPVISLVQRDLWDQLASDIWRMDDGIPPKTHRLKSLGNAVVPEQAKEAFKRLLGLF